MTDWTVEPPRRGWLSRLLAPESHARPDTSAFVVAALGAAAFIASLTMQWQSVTAPVHEPSVVFSLPASSVSSAAPAVTMYTYKGAVTSPELLGLVYALGMIALLAVAGAVINRTDLALRLRLAASGLTVGLFGVVIGIMTMLPTALTSQLGATDQSAATVSYEPGSLFAFAAVALPIVAIFLAGRPALRRASARLAQRYADGSLDEDADLGLDSPVEVRRPGGHRASGWAVRHDEPIDLTVTPER